MSNEIVGFGITTWDEPSQVARQNSGDLKRFDFMRLKDGNNIVRIITHPYKYNMVRVKNPEDKGFGKRVNCSWPLFEEGLDGKPDRSKPVDPAVKAGFAPKKRYLVGVIDRNDNEVKVLDMSVIVYDQLHAIKDDVEYGDPQGFDINIRMNSKASPLQYYTVLPRQITPLSTADVELKESTEEELNTYLRVRTMPLKPETVLQRMEEAGFRSNSNPEVNTSEQPSNGLADTKDEDYDFEKNQPSA